MIRTSMINGNVTCKSTLTTTTTNSNVLVSYFLPTPYNNSITPVNQAATSVVNLCTATTAGTERKNLNFFVQTKILCLWYLAPRQVPF